MTTTVNRCMIVPAAHVERARIIAATLAPVSGERMWTSPCSPTGTAPPTHWITEGPIGSDFAFLLTSPAHLHGACQAADLPDTLEELTTLLAECDISEESPQAAMARVGIVLVQEPML